MLFREHGDAVYQFSLRRTGDPHLAEDVRAAVFFEAWRRRNDIDFEQRPPRPWLFGVAANVVRNHMRAGRRHDAARRRLPEAALDAEHGDDISDAVADRLDLAARASVAVELVDRLPPNERDVVVLCLAYELSYNAAAAALAVPVGTIRSRLSRARHRIRSLEAAG